MSRDKTINTPTARECEQIEDMACNIHDVLESENIPFWETHLIATKLFDKGYRRESDIAKEIFDKLEYLSMDGRIPMNGYYYELKNKYESEGEE